MNLRELREEAWYVTRDTNAMTDADRLWPTKEMNLYINRIYRYIAKETLCIVDSISELCTIPIVGSEATPASNIVPLDSRILSIIFCKWEQKQVPLFEESVQHWAINWESNVGLPTKYARDYSSGVMALNFKPDFSDNLKLRVHRMPLVPLENDDDVPEFDEKYHDYFINGILWQMHLKEDAETLNKTKAAEFQGLFLRDIDDMKQCEIRASNVPVNNYVHYGVL